MGALLADFPIKWEGVAALLVRKFILVALCALIASFTMRSAPAHAQFGGSNATAVREGWEFPPGDVRILVFRPEVRVGAQAVGGVHEPRADWTETAKANIFAALEEQQEERGTQFVLVREAEEQHAELLADYSALFRVVANAAFQHKLFPGDRLPSKRREFDWTLGDEASALRDMGGDFGLFLYSYDSYGSTGRKILQAVGILAGVGFIPSGVHVGYAGLVDLRSGDLVWLNVDVKMGGDPREPEGARKRVQQLLDDFPLKPRVEVIVGTQADRAGFPETGTPDEEAEASDNVPATVIEEPAE